MSEPIYRLKAVRLDTTEQRASLSVLLLIYSVFILDLGFLIWGILRLLLIAFPRLQFEVVGFIYQAMAFTRDAYFDYIFEALKKLFLLPSNSVFSLPDVILNAFVTVFVFVLGLVLYKVVQKALLK